ncbi:MAG: hypothetical protein D6734_12405 [Candidatus Schekmanbacteria bacterium]|nr:MAG: hypothetical protein D6734_12405 [Candidatus Schekmanbacteria bacterium]
MQIACQKIGEIIKKIDKFNSLKYKDICYSEEMAALFNEIFSRKSLPCKEKFAGIKKGILIKKYPPIWIVKVFSLLK